MTGRRYDALLVDLDGTLLDARGEVHPRNREALQLAAAAGARVVFVTGRSKIAARRVLATFDFDSPWVLFNGAAVYCPVSEALLEERTLSKRALERLLAYGHEHDHLTIVMAADEKVAIEPRDELERAALAGLEGLAFAAREELRRDFTIRVTFLSDRHTDSGRFASEIEARVGEPVYVTHFPLSVLPQHRSSRMHAVDVHAPCRGKAEALRLVRERYGIAPERVVAVGDASNDVPMLREAGLGVAMENSMPELLEVADLTIGHHDTDAIGRLVERVFLDGLEP